ncbi:hypothetical protein [Nitratireductor sp. XY-223]|uniref:hypothetical protein n=1 Tax=Nitratireductor sp. XY-223 TaxID=2561926 RepID=UPI0010AAD6FA|nr:hypothetical protein [Nitratireductor sp. XY-223]
MQAFPGGLRLAGRLLIITGILHCLAWIVSGWSGDTMRLIPFGLVYIALGAGLFYRIRTIRYLAFIVTLVGIVAAYISLGSAAVAVWLVWVFIAIDLVVLAILIASIWRGRQPA